MMAVIVDQRKRTSTRERNLTIALEAPADPLEFSQCGNDGIFRHPDFQSHGYSGQSIQYIVHARQIERNFQVYRHTVVAAQRCEAHLRILMPHIYRPYLRILVKAIGGYRLAD